MARVHVWIRGHVQGVWFRESLRLEAERWQVRGWVRNIPDGRVEAVLDGSGDAVDAVVAWCRKGPERAEVEGVEVRAEAGAERFEGFRVLR